MARKPSHERLLNAALVDLEKAYYEKRKDELGLLHNKLAEVIAAENASPQHVLLVLEMLKLATLEHCMAMFFPEQPPIREGKGSSGVAV